MCYDSQVVVVHDLQPRGAPRRFPPVPAKVPAHGYCPCALPFVAGPVSIQPKARTYIKDLNICFTGTLDMRRALPHQLHMSIDAGHGQRCPSMQGCFLATAIAVMQFNCRILELPPVTLKSPKETPTLRGSFMPARTPCKDSARQRLHTGVCECKTLCDHARSGSGWSEEV